jgi:hypothetical protein
MTKKATEGGSLIIVIMGYGFREMILLRLMLVLENGKMNKPTYTPQEMQNRFIACSLLLDPPGLGAVIHATGVNEGLPVLYNSIQEAQEDMFFDEDWDHIIPASEYFDRVATNNFKF